MTFRIIRVWILLFVAFGAVPSYASTSLDLTSPSGYAFTVDSPVLDLPGSFTIEVQFMSLSVHEGCLVAKFHQSSGSSEDDAYYILAKSDGGIQARIQTTALLVTLNAAGNVHNGQWHHVALVYDTTADIAELYLDGNLGASATLNGSVRDNDESLRIGTLRTTNVLTDFFDGYIDELRFWNRARREEQASCLSTVTILNNTPGLISYYRFDEESGTTAFDLIAPFENLSFISGATFDSNEPPLQSRLSGAGICLCGSVSGNYDSDDPAITLVGDTVRIEAGDTLSLSSTSLTLDSTVTVFDVSGVWIVGGAVGDSSTISSQTGAGETAEIQVSGNAELSFVNVSGFAERVFDITSTAEFRQTSFINNGGVMYIEGADIVIDRCEFEGNSSVSDPVIELSSAGVSDVGIINSVFWNNQTTAVLSANAQIAIIGCEFSGNVSSIAVLDVSDLFSVEHCTFFDNTASTILSTYGNSADCSLDRLTIVANSGIGATVSGTVVLRNSIVTENNSTDQINANSSNVSYCLTSDTEFHGAGGSFDTDPLFYDFENRDLRLTAGSQAINRGNPNAIYNDDDGSRADIGAITAENFAATLQSILDVPHDNGRNVMIQWLPSLGDDSRAGIESYSIYRRVNLVVLENFELLAEIPAAQLEGYGQIVTTLADSNGQGWPYYAYFVRAQSLNPLAFWDTPIDSGYSADNLAPEAPLLFADGGNNEIELSWTAVADSDLAYYVIYRAEQPFDPDTVMEIYATTTDTTLMETGLFGDGYAYAVRAVDINDNFSEPSNAVWVPLTPLLSPFGLTISIFSGLAELHWYSVETATSYNLYRKNDFSSPATLFATTSDTVFITPVNGDQRVFYVTAER